MKKMIRPSPTTPITIPRPALVAASGSDGELVSLELTRGKKGSGRG